MIVRLKELLREQGAENALMSGSGPTVFGIFMQKDEAEKAACAVRERRLAGQVFVTVFQGGVEEAVHLE